MSNNKTKSRYKFKEDLEYETFNTVHKIIKNTGYIVF